MKPIIKQATLHLGVVLLICVFATTAQAGEYYKQNLPADLKTICINDNTDNYCSVITDCNVTVFNSNGTLLATNAEMDNHGTYYNYTLSSGMTSATGEYSGSLYCKDGNYTQVLDFTFNVNPVGQEITDSQGFASIGMIIGMILLAAIFGFFGFKFSESEKLFPIALFFMLGAMVLGVYVIQMSYIFSRDILYPLTMDGMQFKIYLGFMWGLLAMGFIALTGLIVKTLQEFKARKSLHNESDGYDYRNN